MGASESERSPTCRLQLGGSDQWGNIVGGTDLTRRMEGAEAYGFTTPLITTASGGKMGKTADGAVWLNADEKFGKEFTRSPYDYWQFWRNTEDADVGKFLRLFTDLPLDQIAELEALEGAEINKAKVKLANEATALLHGAAEALRAAETAEKTFAQGGAAAGLPTFETPAADLGELTPVDAGVFVELCASKGEARRHIKAGALKVNDTSVTDPMATLSAKDVNPDGVIKISVGKKRHALIKPV